MNNEDFNELFSNPKTIEELYFRALESYFADMMSETLNAAVIDQAPDTSLEQLKAITEAALENAWKDKLNARQASRIKKAEFFALADAACDKPRSQAFEEWLNASDDEASSSRYYYSDSFPERAEKSKLYELG